MSATTVYKVAPTPPPVYTGPGGAAPNSQFTQISPTGAVTGPGAYVAPAPTPALPSATSTTPSTTQPKKNPPVLPAASTPVAPAAGATPNTTFGNDPTAPSDATTKLAMSTLSQTPNQLAEGEADYIHEQEASSSDIISGIENEFQSAISEGYGNANAAANAAGMAGSPEAAAASLKAIQPVLDDQAGQVATAMESIASQAATDWQNAQTEGTKNAEDVLAAKQTSQTNVQNTFKSIATAVAAQGLSLPQFIQQNPDEASYIQDAGYNGDYNAMSAAFALAIPPDQVVQTWTSGTTYNQLTRNPQTNKISVQSFDTGTAVPSTWASNKISTTTLMMQDPNNPANTVIYTTDPLTGGVTVLGTGTGQQIADQYNQNQAGSLASGSPSDGTSPTGAGTASTTVASILGVPPTSALSDVIQNSGVGPVVAALIKNEGGSPAGVSNNPGNVKFTGAPGQTDSGVKATDGGTFASYDTPEDGEAAIADIVNNAAAGQSSSYGAAPTLQSFVDTYTNTGSGSPSASTTGTNGLSTAQYGLLSNVQGFDPGPSTGSKTDSQAVDSAAFNYLQVYLKTGSVPTTTNVLGMRSGTSAELPRIAQRAEDLYTQATGQALPDQDILDSNKGYIASNNSLLNSLAVQEQTISANSDLLQGSINAENINQNAPVINGILDKLANAFGDPNTAAYLAQNSTLSNELGSLLALKNASGTTVHDKLISADLISPDASAKQEADVVNRLMQEATNAHSAITLANAKLYIQNDPLGLDPQNPIANPTSFAQSVGLDLDAIKQDYPDMTDSEIIQQYVQSQ